MKSNKRPGETGKHHSSRNRKLAKPLHQPVHYQATTKPKASRSAARKIPLGPGAARSAPGKCCANKAKEADWRSSQGTQVLDVSDVFLRLSGVCYKWLPDSVKSASAFCRQGTAILEVEAVEQNHQSKGFLWFF